jgi:hypothetical protein
MADQEVTVPENVPEELKETVRQRILTSQRKYQALKNQQNAEKAALRVERKAAHEKRQTFRKLIYEGAEFFKENKDHIINGRLKFNEDFEIAYAVMQTEYQDLAPKGTYLCRACYTIKSPTDTWSDDIATGLCGYRLKNLTEWTTTIAIPAMIFDCAHNILEDTIDCIIRSRILLMAPEIPQRVINQIFGELQKRHKNRHEVRRLLDESKMLSDIGDFSKARVSLTKALKLNKSSDTAIKQGLDIINMREITAERNNLTKNIKKAVAESDQPN